MAPLLYSPPNKVSRALDAEYGAEARPARLAKRKRTEDDLRYELYWKILEFKSAHGEEPVFRVTSWRKGRELTTREKLWFIHHGWVKPRPAWVDEERRRMLARGV